MTTITITTKNGAEVEMTISEEGSVGANVIGTMHSTPWAELVEDSTHGLCVKICNAKAPISAGDIAAARALFADAAKIKAAWLEKAAEEYRNSSEGFSDRMNARMYGRNSDH